MYVRRVEQYTPCAVAISDEDAESLLQMPVDNVLGVWGYRVRSVGTSDEVI